MTILDMTARSDDNGAGWRRARIRTALAVKPDGVLETIARELDVSTQIVLEMTPPDECLFIPADRFEEIWRELTSWGEVIFIVHTQDIVLECMGSLPIGSFAHGYYNLSSASPVHGHIKTDNCRAIYLVDRLFHGRRSCSAQFFNAAGEAMFKVFAGRDAARELLPDQIVRFEALWEKCS